MSIRDLAHRTLQDHWRGLAVALGAGVFMAGVGAFGTDAAPLGRRLVYWLPAMVGGTLIGLAAQAAVSRRPTPPFTHPVVQWAAVTAAVTAPGALLIWWWTGVMFPDGGNSVPFFFLAVLIVSAPMTAVMMLAYRPGAATHAIPAAAGAGPPATPRFFERFPAKVKGARLYAVEAEDHYLRLHTSKGTDLILFRLIDAIAELDGVEGAQTHRSWWVAKDAVEGVRRQDGKVTLLLPGGLVAPVSRANVKPLREAQWL